MAIEKERRGDFIWIDVGFRGGAGDLKQLIQNKSRGIFATLKRAKDFPFLDRRKHVGWVEIDEETEVGEEGIGPGLAGRGEAGDAGGDC